MTSTIVTLVAFVILATANLNSALQATSFGFLASFNRSQPLILLHTSSGIQMLTGNGTCYNNRTSVYYPSENRVKYVSYSTEENYLLIVNELDKICFRNLYKSNWNNGMKRDLRRQCRSQNIHNMLLYSLSIASHVLFAVNKDGHLYMISLEEPMCSTQITGSLYTKDLRALHVTNFGRGLDLVLVGQTNRVSVHLTSGEAPKNILKLPATDTLEAISSSEDEQFRNFFLAVTRSGQFAVILKFKGQLHMDASEVIFGPVAHRQVVSLSSSNDLLAIMLRDTQQLGSYWIHARAPVAKTERNESVYQCNAGHGLIEAIVVRRRAQRIVNYCDQNEQAMQVCKGLGEGQMCDFKKALYYKPQVVLNATKIESEMEHKATLTLAFAITGMVVCSLFQVLRNTRFL